MKACIACAEEIQEAAKLCRYCKTRQDDLSFAAPQSQAPEDAEVKFVPLFTEESASKLPPRSSSSGAGVSYGLGFMVLVIWTIFMTVPNGWRWNALSQGPCVPNAATYCTVDPYDEVLGATLAFLLIAGVFFAVGFIRATRK